MVALGNMMPENLGDIPNKLAQEIRDRRAQFDTLNAYVRDLIARDLSNRTKPDTLTCSIRWPVDWWDRMVRRWGRNRIAMRVRELIHADLSKRWEISELPAWRAGREVEVYKARKKLIRTFPSPLTLPVDWVDAIRSEHGERGLSRYVKSVVFPVLDNDTSKPLSPVK